MYRCGEGHTREFAFLDTFDRHGHRGKQNDQVVDDPAEVDQKHQNFVGAGSDHSVEADKEAGQV